MSDAHGHDDWFRHSDDEALPQVEHAEHVSTKALGITLVAIVFGVLFVILILAAYFSSYTTQVRAERQENTTSAAEYLSYRSGVDRRLVETGWVDRNAQTLHIPLDRAIDLVVDEYVAAGVPADTRPTEGEVASAQE